CVFPLPPSLQLLDQGAQCCIQLLQRCYLERLHAQPVVGSKHTTRRAAALTYVTQSHRAASRLNNPVVVFWRQHPCLLWSNIPGWMSPTEVHHQKFGPRTVARQLLLDPIAAVKNRFASRSVFDGRVGGKAIPAAVKAERFERV